MDGNGDDHNGTMRGDGIYNEGFDPSWWCLLGINDEEEESDESTLSEDVEVEEVGKRALNILASQRKVLGRICESSDPGGDDGGTPINLKYDDLLIRFLFYRNHDRAFMIDLVGCVRRQILIQDDTDRTAPWSVCISNRFLDAMNRFCLEELFEGCLSDLSDIQALHFDGCEFRKIRPILQSVHRVKELRLTGLEVNTQGDINNFANCFAATSMAATTTAANIRNSNRWENLTTLVIEIVELPDGSEADLYPILHVIGGGNDRNHLPNLEIFNLYQKNSNLSADDSLIAFMNNRKTIKLLTLIGFIKPRHCHLMERHLSAHPKIQTLLLDAEDFFQGGRSAPFPEEKPAVCEAMRSLVGLATSNQNIKTISIDGPFSTSLDDLLQPHLRELFARTELNRNGLKHFLGGVLVESSATWTRRECIEFLIKLRILEGNDLVDWHGSYGEEFDSLVVLDALYLSLRMRPDLCLLSQAGSGALNDNELLQTLDAMGALSL